jgi:hypothetical protein
MCGTALPPDTCAFGDWFGIVFGEADPPSARLELVAFSAWQAFANQTAPIKVLPFRGSYAFTTSISDRFPRISCERLCCSLDSSRAGIPYCRRANRLHFGRTGTEEKAAGW